MVTRNEVEDLEEAHVEPISANVEMELTMTINKLERLQQIDLYHTFTSVDATKVVAGLLYESLGHILLQEGIALTLKPMIRSQPREFVHWKSRGEVQEQNSMDMDNTEISETFPPNTATIYEGRPSSVLPNRLHLPTVRNQVALDSFFQLDSIFYIFQFTLAKDYDIKKGMKESLSGLLNILPTKTNWRFVFITPPGCEVDVKAVSEEVVTFLEGVTLYSAHLEIK